LLAYNYCECDATACSSMPAAVPEGGRQLDFILQFLNGRLTIGPWHNFSEFRLHNLGSEIYSLSMPSLSLAGAGRRRRADRDLARSNPQNIEQKIITSFGRNLRGQGPYAERATCASSEGVSPTRSMAPALMILWMERRKVCNACGSHFDVLRDSREVQRWQ